MNIRTSEEKKANRIFALIFMAYSVSYVARKAYSACMTDICSELSMTRSFAGAVSTGYLACYGVGQLFSGAAADRISPKKMIAVGLFGAGASNILSGLARGPVMLLVFWCLNGVFQSMLWSPVVRAIAMWIPDERRSFAGTTISVSLPAGTALSYLLSSLCLRLFSWRVAFAAAGVIAVLGGAVWLLGVSAEKDHLSKIQAEKRSAAAEGPAKSGASVTLFYCIASCGLVFTVISILFNGILKDGITEWIPSYLTEVFGTDPSSAAFFVTLLPLINVAGSYLGAWITRKYTRNEMTTGAILFGTAFASAAALVFFGRTAGGGSSLSVLFCVLLFAVITCAMQGANNMFLTFMPLHFAPVNRTASVTGFLNSCSYLAAALSGVISGTILEGRGWTALQLFWLLCALAGIPLCLIGAGRWKIGRKNIGQSAGQKS